MGYTGERCLTGRSKVWTQSVINNNNINKNIYVAYIIFKFAIKTKALGRLQEWILCRHSLMLLSFFCCFYNSGSKKSCWRNEHDRKHIINGEYSSNNFFQYRDNHVIERCAAFHEQ